MRYAPRFLGEHGRLGPIGLPNNFSELRRKQWGRKPLLGERGNRHGIPAGKGMGPGGGLRSLQ